MNSDKLCEYEDQIDLEKIQLAVGRREAIAMTIGSGTLSALSGVLIWWGVFVTDESTFLSIMATCFSVLAAITALAVLAGALEAWANLPTRIHKLRCAQRNYERVLVSHAEEILQDRQ